MAADQVPSDDSRLAVVRFQEVPDQVPLTDDVTTQSRSDVSFERRIDALSAALDVEIEADEVVSHDTKHAIVNVAEARGVDTVVAEHEPLRLRSRLVGDPVDWVVRHAPCDVLLVDNLGYDRPERVVLSGTGGPFSPLAVTVADAIGAANGGDISLWFASERSAGDGRRRALDEYRSELSAMLSAPVRSAQTRADGGQPDPDVVVRRGTDQRLRTALFDDRPPVPGPGCTTITVYPRESRRSSFVRRLLEQATF